MIFRSAPSFAALLGALASCSPAPIDDRFSATGELIALSGGDAGPRAACHTCHGLDGGGDGHLVPRIAALDSGYLVRQLGFFADGQRSHPQMSWLAGRLGSEQRLAVSTYYGSMPMPEAAQSPLAAAPAICDLGNAPAIYHEGLPERGLAACASCHGEDGAGVGAGHPSLVGQSDAYHAEQLRRWRTGQRFGDPLNVMHDAASRLREDEITPLAVYIADGPGRSRRRGSREECP